MSRKMKARRKPKKISRLGSLAKESRFADSDALEECMGVPIVVAGLAGGVAAGVAALITRNTSVGSAGMVTIPALAGLVIGVLSGTLLAKNQGCFE